MLFQVGDESKKRARAAHNLYIVNILLFHLLATPAAIALDIGFWGVLVPLGFSAAIIATIYLRSRSEPDWFAAAHWRLAFRRARILLLGYALSGALFLVGWLITFGIDKESMRHIMQTVFTRIAVMPTLVTVMITVVLEASGINQVGQGEVPQCIVRDFAPPEDLPRQE